VAVAASVAAALAALGSLRAIHLAAPNS